MTDCFFLFVWLCEVYSAITNTFNAIAQCYLLKLAKCPKIFLYLLLGVILEKEMDIYYLSEEKEEGGRKRREKERER